MQRINEVDLQYVIGGGADELTGYLIDNEDPGNWLNCSGTIGQQMYVILGINGGAFAGGFKF